MAGPSATVAVDRVTADASRFLASNASKASLAENRRGRPRPPCWFDNPRRNITASMNFPFIKEVGLDAGSGDLCKPGTLTKCCEELVWLRGRIEERPPVKQKRRQGCFRGKALPPVGGDRIQFADVTLTVTIGPT